MVGPQITERRNGIYAWRIDTNTRNKQSDTADKGLLSRMSCGRGNYTSSFDEVLPRTSKMDGFGNLVSHVRTNVG